MCHGTGGGQQEHQTYDGGLTYVCIYLVGKVCAEQRCEEESNAQSNVRQTACADAEAIYTREDLYGRVSTKVRDLSAGNTYRERWRT